MFNTRTLLKASDLLRIKVGENHSPLVGLREKLPFLCVRYEKEDMLEYTGDDILVREDLIPLIKMAYEALQETNPGFNFLVRYGYRHPDVQKRYYLARYNVHRLENPEMSENELIELTHTQVAFPEVGGHPTGGAVDLTILDEEGDQLDMGTGIADYSDPDKCFTYSVGITEDQAQNRKLLAQLMIDAGFAPYNGEWWHFSYGDREWACFYEKEQSIFDQIEFKI